MSQSGSGNYAFGQPWSDSNSTIATATRTRTGTALPGWKKIIENMGNATTSMTAIYDTIRADRGNIGYDIFYPGAGTARYRTRGDLRLSPFGLSGAKLPRPPTLIDTECDNRARQAFYSKLRKLQTQFQGQVFAGELRETLRMIKSPAKALRDGLFGYLEDLKRRKKRDPRHWARAIGGTYLEHAFGWAPLANDIRDAYDAYKRITNRTGIHAISAGAVMMYDRTSSLSGIPGANTTARIGVGTYDFVKGFDLLFEQHKVRYKGLFVASRAATQRDDLKSVGLTFDEFIPSAWELLPWSWLLDYFLNIGDILNNNATSTADVRWVNRTSIRTTTWKGGGNLDVSAIKAAVGAGQTVTVVSDSPGSFEVSRKEIVRSANTGIPAPTLQFQAPGAGQLSNVAALLATAFSVHPQHKPKLSRWWDI